VAHAGQETMIDIEPRRANNLQKNMSTNNRIFNSFAVEDAAELF
jgi:hypothetical protein